MLRSLYRSSLGRTRLGRTVREWFRRMALRPRERAYRLAVDPSEFDSRATYVVGNSRILRGANRVHLNISGTVKQFLKGAENYLLQEEATNTLQYLPGSKQVLLPDIKICAKVSGRWFSLCHPSSENWMHWLSECLPTAGAICEDPRYDDCGIIYDLKLPKSARDSLKIVAGNRPLLGIEPNSVIAPERLYQLPENSAGWTLFWPRHEKGLGHFYFSKQCMQQTRRRIFEQLNIRPEPSARLFITRTSNFRIMEGQENLGQELESSGFEMIDPGQLTFAEQVRAFSRCNIIIAQAGAAMANIMFMPEGPTLICLHADSEYANPEYFQEYADTFGVRIRFLRGQIVDPKSYDSRRIADELHPMNAKFRIDQTELRNTIYDIDRSANFSARAA